MLASLPSSLHQQPPVWHAANTGLRKPLKLAGCLSTMHVSSAFCPEGHVLYGPYSTAPSDAHPKALPLKLHDEIVVRSYACGKLHPKSAGARIRRCRPPTAFVLLRTSFHISKYKFSLCRRLQGIATRRRTQVLCHACRPADTSRAFQPQQVLCCLSSVL